MIWHSLNFFHIVPLASIFQSCTKCATGSRMASYNSILTVDQNRSVEVKRFDALSKRVDLLPGMLSRVNRIRKD
jgi:hypothetical protein